MGAVSAPSRRRAAYRGRMINPGAGPVQNATFELAEANMRAFLAEVAEQAGREGETRGYEPQVGEADRETGSDLDGRYGWILPINGIRVWIRMPGAPLVEVRAMGADAPVLFVDDEPLWWLSAVMAAVPLPGR